MNTLPHACVSAHLRTARWHAFLSLLRSTPFRSDKLTLCFSPLISDRMVVVHSFSTVPLKYLGALSTLGKRYETHLHLASQICTQRTSHTPTPSLRAKKDVRRCCATDCTSCCASRPIIASASFGRKWSIWLLCRSSTLYRMRAQRWSR